MSLETIYSPNIPEFSVNNSVGEYIIDTNTFKFLGYFSIQTEITGGGTVNVDYAVTNLNKVGFSTPVSIITGSTVGVADLTTFEPPVCRYIKFIVTETATSATAVKLHLRGQ